MLEPNILQFHGGDFLFADHPVKMHETGARKVHGYGAQKRKDTSVGEHLSVQRLDLHAVNFHLAIEEFLVARQCHDITRRVGKQICGQNARSKDNDTCAKNS